MILQRLFNISIDMLCVADINDGCFKIINGAFEKTLGYTQEELLQEPFIHFVHPDDRSKTISAVEKLSKGESIINFDNRYRCKDGSYKWLAWTSAPVPDKGLTYAIARDITDHKRAEKELRESEEKYKTLFANAGDALFIMEVDAKRRFWFIECNQRTLGMFGCDHSEIIGKSIDFFSPETQPDGKLSMERTIELIRLVMEEGHAQDFQWLCHRYDNKEPLWVEVNLTRLTLGGKTNYMQAVVRDITKRKQAEKVIQNLSRQLLTSQENERQMISYELHDIVAQDLSSSRIICEMLLKDNSLTPEARKQISEVSGNLHKTLKGVRDLSYELRPSGIENLGLTHSMYQFCKDFSERTGVRVDFQSAGIENLNLNYNTKINLYRLLQESLNNVKKHADAGNAKIRLISSFPNVILRIEDDGNGFDLKKRLARTSSEKRMGLSSMEERVALLMGSINIESSPGKGTKVVIEIPHEDKNKRAWDEDLKREKGQAFHGTQAGRP